VNNGADLRREVAQVVLMEDNMAKLLTAIDVSMEAIRLIRWPLYEPRKDLIANTMSLSASRFTIPKNPGNLVSKKRRLKVNCPR